MEKAMNSSKCESHDADSNDDADLLMFEIDKTLSACHEAQKKRQGAFNLFLVMLTMLAIITFSAETKQEVTIPIIQLKLSKWYAAELLLILTCGSFFRMMSMHAYARMLRRKVASLFGKRRIPWNIEYPSVFEYSVISQNTGARLVPFVMFVVLIGGGYVFPILCAAIVGINTEYAVPWIIACAISLLFLTGTVVVFMQVGKIDRIIDRLEASE